MSFFEKLFGSQKEREAKGQIHPPVHSAQSLRTLLELYGCIALERQLICNQLVANKPSMLDLDICVIRIEPDLLLDARILGTFGIEQQTWKWSWANAASNFSDKAIAHAQQLRRYGMENGIEAFTMDSLPANSVLLQKIGLIATVLCRASGYLFIPYNNAQILLTVDSPILNITPPGDDEHLHWIISQFTAKFEVHEKTAIACYLRSKGFQVSVLDNDLAATKNNKNILIECSGEGKLLRFNGEAPAFRN